MQMRASMNYSLLYVAAANVSKNISNSIINSISNNISNNVSNNVSNNISKSVSKSVSKHFLKYANRPRAASVVFGEVLVLHNETFGVWGLKHDIEAPIWSGVMAGVVIACMCVACLSACFARFWSDVEVQQRYEGIPLITIRHGRR